MGRPAVEIRPARTHADRLAVTAVAHAATHPEQPLAHFQALRLAHARRALATWWLLEEDGRPVGSLVCHPLTFTAGGRVLPGYGLGAVSTVPEARRRGHAAALCRHAIAHAEAEGRSVGLLYSAIPPAYYERLGFRALPARHHVGEDPSALAASGPQHALLPLDPLGASAGLAALYEAFHGDALHLHRDAAGFRSNLALNAGDLVYGIGDPLRGYARTTLDETSLEVSELVVPPADRAPTLRALADLAARLGRSRLEGWFDPVAELAGFLADRGRATTLPMVRGAEPDPRARFWSSDYF